MFEIGDRMQIQKNKVYKDVNQKLYASKYRDFCLQGGEGEFALRLSEFNMLFYIGTDEQDNTVHKYITHLLDKIQTQYYVSQIQEVTYEYNKHIRHC